MRRFPILLIIALILAQTITATQIDLSNVSISPNSLHLNLQNIAFSIPNGNVTFSNPTYEKTYTFTRLNEINNSFIYPYRLYNQQTRNPYIRSETSIHNKLCNLLGNGTYVRRTQLRKDSRDDYHIYSVRSDGSFYVYYDDYFYYLTSLTCSFDFRNFYTINLSIDNQTLNSYNYTFQKQGIHNLSVKICSKQDNTCTKNSKTFNIKPFINLNFYDYTTHTQIGNVSVTINNQNNILNHQDNVTNYLYFFNSDQDNLKITIQKQDYAQSTLHSKITSSSSINRNIYLVQQTNTDLFSISVEELGSFKPLHNVLLSLYYHDGINDFFTTEILTNEQGKAQFLKDTSSNVKVILTKNNYIKKESTIFSTDFLANYYLQREPQIIQGFSFDGFSYKLEGKERNFVDFLSDVDSLIDNLNSSLQFKCSYFDDYHLVDEVRCFLYIQDQLLNSTISTNSHKGTLTLNINQNSFYQKYTLKMEVTRQGKKQIFTKDIPLRGTQDRDSKLEFKILNIIQRKNYNQSEAEINPNYFQHHPEYWKPFLALFMMLFFFILGFSLFGYVGFILGGLVFFFLASNIGLISDFIAIIFILLFLILLGQKIKSGGF